MTIKTKMQKFKGLVKILKVNYKTQYKTIKELFYYKDDLTEANVEKETDLLLKKATEDFNQYVDDLLKEDCKAYLQKFILQVEEVEVKSNVINYLLTIADVFSVSKVSELFLQRFFKIIKIENMKPFCEVEIIGGIHYIRVPKDEVENKEEQVLDYQFLGYKNLIYLSKILEMACNDLIIFRKNSKNTREQWQNIFYIYKNLFEAFKYKNGTPDDNIGIMYMPEPLERRKENEMVLCSFEVQNENQYTNVNFHKDKDGVISKRKLDFIKFDESLNKFNNYLIRDGIKEEVCFSQVLKKLLNKRKVFIRSNKQEFKIVNEIMVKAI